MLNKTDLEQIGKIIDSKLDTKLNSVLDIKLKPIKKDLRYLRKTLDVLVDRTYKADVALGKRVTRIETHLQI